MLVVNVDPRAFWLRGALALVIALTLLAVYMQASHAKSEHAEATRHVPLAEPSGGYASSRECRACHAEQYASWYASYHRSMTQPAGRESVRGSFDDVALTHGKERVILSRADDTFAMAVQALPPLEQPAPRPQALATLPQGTYPVTLVTGSHHMQVYWYETGQGRSLGQVPFVYLHEDARWVPRHMVFLRPPNLFRSGESGRWNSTCSHCHSTSPKPQLARDGEHDTRVAELGIACEACHGPGREHVTQMSSPLARYTRHLQQEQHAQDAPDKQGKHAIVNPSELSPARASAVCSQCHAMWLPKREYVQAYHATGAVYRPGDDPEQTQWLFEPSRRDDPRVQSAMRQDREYAPGQFWSDGQARVSGREYNGMIESACLQSGQLSCLSCHTMHREPGDKRSDVQWAEDQLAHDKTNDNGDGACLGCHAELGRSITQHTRHDESSAGSRCYNCHMPHTSWGLLKAMRSHRIGSPSVQETLQTGRPNACTLCHLDQSLRWAAGMLQERFGVEAPNPAELAPQEHAVAAGVSLSLMGDAGQRALLAAAMRRPEVQQAAGSAWMPAVLGVLMDDPYDAVRYVAGHALQSLPGFRDFPYDFILRPHERPEVAEEVARRGAAAVVEAASAGTLVDSLPFDERGMLSQELKSKLLSRRDHRSVHLLE